MALAGSAQQEPALAAPDLQLDRPTIWEERSRVEALADPRRLDDDVVHGGHAAMVAGRTGGVNLGHVDGGLRYGLEGAAGGS